RPHDQTAGPVNTRSRHRHHEGDGAPTRLAPAWHKHRPPSARRWAAPRRCGTRPSAELGAGRRTEGGRARRRRDRRGARPPGGSASPCRNPAACAVRAGADGTLFEWLTTLYRPWSKMDAEVVSGAATAALGWLAKSGCTTSSDHHYLFPGGRGDLFAAEIEAARELGVRFHPCRGALDRGESDGGLPPDEVVEDLDTILAETAAAIDRYHDPSPGSMLRVAVAPCSPFSVTRDLLTESARLARDRGVRLHTHLAETLDEE